MPDTRWALDLLACPGLDENRWLDVWSFPSFSRLDALTMGDSWAFRPAKAHCQLGKRLHCSGEPCAGLKIPCAAGNMLIEGSSDDCVERSNFKVLSRLSLHCVEEIMF